MRKYHLVFVVLAIVINAILFHQDFHWDTTPDQRWTLSDEAKDLLQSQEEPLVITVLLHGNLGADFKAYRDFIDHYLFELRRVRRRIEVIYKNPNEGSFEEVNTFRRFLASRGVTPLSRRVSSKEEVSTSLVYPFLSVHNSEDIIFVNLLTSTSLNRSSDGMIESMVQFEPKLIKAIRDLNTGTNKRILVGGDGSEILTSTLNRHARELGPWIFQEWTPSMQIPSIDSINGFILVDKGRGLDRNHLLLADQLTMQGKPCIWLVDRFDVTIDSIQRYDTYTAIPQFSTTEDYLFRAGVRIDPSLVMDLNSSSIPQVVGQRGGQAEIANIPYPFHLVISDKSQMDILRMTEPVSLYFVSTLDTVRTKAQIQKSYALTTSPYVKIRPSPVDLEFNFLRVEPDPSEFGEGPVPIGILLEGAFESYFNNRLSSADRNFLAKGGMSYMAEAEGSVSQMVISDTDFIFPFVQGDGSVAPVGYNKWDRRMYPGNLQLLSNSLEILSNGPDILDLVKREFAVAPIDIPKFKQNQNRYYSVLVAWPLLIIFVLSFTYKGYRRRRYEGDSRI